MLSMNPKSWASDNTTSTMWPCFQATQLLVIALWLYWLWLHHLDTETWTYFVFLRVTVALQYHVVAVAKLKLSYAHAALALFRYTLGQVGAGGWPQRRGTDSGTCHTIPKIIWNFRKKNRACHIWSRRKRNGIFLDSGPYICSRQIIQYV